MAGTTPVAKLPYPTGTDKVRNGAAAIQALAVALDPLVVNVKTPVGALAADSYTTYPMGVSTQYLTPAQVSAGGWPGSDYCIVTTWRSPTGSGTYQTLTYATNTAGVLPYVYLRTASTLNSGAWTAWEQIGGPPANVTVLASPVASNVLPTTDTYPAGVSCFSLSGAQAAADGGWPYGVTSHVWTYKMPDARTAQYWYRNNAAGTNQDAWYRQGGSTWTPWVKFAGDTYRAVTAVSNLNVADSTYVALTWGTVEADTGGITQPGSAMVVGTGGLYHITVVATFAGGTAAPNGIMSIGLGVGGGPGSDSTFRAYTASPGTAATVVNGAWDRVMANGESVSAFAYQTNNQVRAVSNRRMTIRRVGN